MSLKKVMKLMPTDTVKVMVFKVEEIPKDKIVNWHPKLRKKIDKYKKVPMPGVYRAKVESINSVSKLAKFIYFHWGIGTFNVYFYGFGKNKKFRHNFKCLKEKCVFYKTKKCRKWKYFQHGMSCKKNPKYTYNWYKRARIEIIPKEDLLLTEKYPYKYRWFYSHDKMNRMFFGFQRD